MESYFHRAGRRVPVLVSACAFVVPRAPDALDPPPRWRVVDLARRHTLLVSRALVERTGVADRGAILRSIRAQAREPDPGDHPVERPAVDAAPVLIRGSLLLCPTGAVVAQFPEGVSADGAAHTLRPMGWAIERPIRFLDRGFVLRATPRDPLDPLSVANRLVEAHRCRFAHPVMLEEVVGAA